MATPKRRPSTMKEHRCPDCGHLLGRYRVVAGEIILDIWCRHCKKNVMLKEAA